MAKQLKAIQCPTCGSPQKVEIRPDTYRCDNCGTEYFLDTDDITINVRQLPPVAPRPAPVPVLASRVRWAIILAGLGLVAGLVLTLVKRQQRAREVSELMPDPIMTGRNERPEWRSTETALVLGVGGQPVLVVAGAQSVPGQYTYTPTVGLYDARTGAAQQLVPLPGGARPQMPTVQLEQLANGTVLVCYDNAVHQVNAAPPGIENVTTSLLANQPALASGIASLDRGSPADDALHLFTNDGHNYSFYPLTRRLYTDDEAWSAARGFQNLRPASPVRTAFIFSVASMRYPETPIQLITYQYRYNDGGPQAKPEFSWDDDYGGSGVFTSADPHEKRLIRRSELANGRVLSFRDFTPGRHYYHPRLLLHDADYVLLTFHTTAAPGSPRVVQALDARTAAIRFSTPLPADAGQPNLALRYPGGFVIGRDQTTYTLSPNGQLGPATTCQ
jgi:hypothetical protein